MSGYDWLVGWALLFCAVTSLGFVARKHSVTAPALEKGRFVRVKVRGSAAYAGVVTDVHADSVIVRRICPDCHQSKLWLPDARVLLRDVTPL